MVTFADPVAAGPSPDRPCYQATSDACNAPECWLDRQGGAFVLVPGRSALVSRTRTSQRGWRTVHARVGVPGCRPCRLSCSTTAEAEDSRRRATASAAPASGEALTSRRQQVRGGDRHVFSPMVMTVERVLSAAGRRHRKPADLRGGTRPGTAPNAAPRPGRVPLPRHCGPDGVVVTTSASPNVIDMPGWRPIAKRAATTVLMVSLLPMAVFYTRCPCSVCGRRC